MALSRIQLDAIIAIIQRRFTTFVYEALGERALTPGELATLHNAGIANRDINHMIMDPASLGRLTALFPPSSRRSVTYDQVLKALERTPPTDVERAAVQFASDHAGEHIKGIRDMMVKDVRTLTARSSEAALRAVKENVATAILQRETISELKTRLFHAIDNRTVDWQRIAHTEMNTAIQQGVYRAMREESADGHNQLAYKRPSAGACRHCRRLYLKSDGTPRVFRLADLEDSNVGLKAADWGPTIGSVHPWCNCQLQVIPEGFDFVKRHVVTEPFEFGGEQWRRGSVVPDEIYGRLDATLKTNVGLDSVLSYTGTTASPEVEKSFAVTHVADDCTCDHD